MLNLISLLVPVPLILVYFGPGRNGRKINFETVPSRVSDLDPDWIRIQSGQWIREGKKDTQKEKKIEKFHV
jgi:hypothetical protein